MASLVPVVEWDRDDYSFRGPIIEVKEVELLEQKGWLVRTTVLRTLRNDIDIDLDILVTHRVWDEDGPPRPGMVIERTLWLQGRLWSPGREEVEIW